MIHSLRCIASQNKQWNTPHNVTRILLSMGSSPMDKQQFNAITITVDN